MTTALLVSRPSRDLSSLDYTSSHRFGIKSPATSLETLFWAVVIGVGVRLTVVALVYKGFLDPARDHWEFGYELGRIARSIALGHGFGNPFLTQTGPTALLTPVYPYFLAGIFALFGVYTKASALVYLSLNCFFSAVTSVPIFLIARKSFSLRTANLAAWVWAFFPYAVDLSTTVMWYHSFIALLLASLFLLVLSSASSDNLKRWAAFGVLLGFAALTNPVIVGISPVLLGWGWVRLRSQRKRAWRAVIMGTVAMLVTILPWVVRNQLVLGHPIAFKDGFWLEVCVGNVNNSLHWWDGEEHPSGSALESARFARLGELRYMAAKRQEAMIFIKGHPGAYALRAFRHVVLMWTGFWSFDPTYLREEPFDPGNMCLSSFLSLLSLAGLFRMFRQGSSKTAMLYLLVLLVFPIPYYLSHLDPGFRHPVDPLLVILACSAITQTFSRRRVVLEGHVRSVSPIVVCHRSLSVTERCLDRKAKLRRCHTGNAAKYTGQMVLIGKAGAQRDFS